MEYNAFKLIQLGGFAKKCAIIAIAIFIMQPVYSAFNDLYSLVNEKSQLNSSSILNDETASFANPARVIRKEGAIVNTSISRLQQTEQVNSLSIDDVQDSFMVLGKFIPFAALGFSASRRNLDAYYNESVLSLGCGVNLFDYVSLGVSASSVMFEYDSSKCLQDNLTIGTNDTSKMYLRYDFGIMIDFAKVSIGMNMKKIDYPQLVPDDINMASQGFLFDLGSKYETNETTIFTQGIFSSYRASIALGVEQVVLGDHMFLKSSVNYFDANNINLSLGGGVKSGPFKFTYTYTNNVITPGLPGSHKLSIIL